jgi:hypothetical protein
MKYTAGPWFIKGKIGCRALICNSHWARIGNWNPSESRCICDVRGPGNEYSPSEEAEANARLIAAAPDLLGALKTVEEFVRTARQYFPKSMHNSAKFDLENTCAAINAAISKAESK